MKPWAFSMDGCETSQGLPIITRAGNGHLVASLCSHSRRDAVTIAAAPMMRAALEEIAAEPDRAVFIAEHCLARIRAIS